MASKKRGTGPEGKRSRTFVEDALEHIQSLSEADLQARVIEPLLRKLGFRNVRDVSGPNERGKDLVAIKSEFGRTKLYAIQLKKLKFSGKSADSNFIGGVISQLRQLFLEPVIDPTSNTPRRPDRGIFLTPYSIDRHALEGVLHQVQEIEQRDLTIIDGPTLIDEILAVIPEAVEALSMSLHYRTQLCSAVAVVQESGAFGLSSRLNLDDIHVDISIGCQPSEFEAVWNSHPIVGATVEIVANPSHVESLVDVVKQVLVEGSATPSFQRQSRKTNEWKVDTRELSSAVHRLVSDAANKIGALADLDPMNTDIDGQLKELRRIGLSYRRLRSNPVMQALWPHLFSESGKRSGRATGVKSSLLRHTRLNVLVSGGPGAGKTTLLRRLAKAYALQGERRLPVLVYLIHTKGTEVADLLDAARKHSNALGLEVSDEEWLKSLENGEICILFDGLDETGNRAAALLASIRQLSERYPMQVVLSCRDTTLEEIGEMWDNVLRVHMQEFSDSEVDEFVARWFESEPSSAIELSKWLSKRKNMRAAAKRPLVSAILCSLVQSGADLPSSEAELYTERINMLLGKWDGAKGIRKMRPGMQKRYWRFLEELAGKAHCLQQRLFGVDQAVFIAKEYFDLGYHGTPRGMVDDAINRGLLERRSDGDLSFGHFSYQEHLVAHWMQRKLSLGEVWGRADSAWWQNALEFYCVLRGDIQDLVELAISRYPIGKGEVKEKWSTWCPRAYRVVTLAGLTSFTPISHRVDLGRLSMNCPQGC